MICQYFLQEVNISALPFCNSDILSDFLSVCELCDFVNSG